MGKLNIPDNLKLMGFNICPKKSDVDSGPGRAWESLFLNWDWDGWIKPQIDYMAGNQVGLNSCRIITGIMGVHLGLYSQEYLNRRMRQLIEYCASLGVYFYVAGTGKSSYAQAPVSVNELSESMGSMLRVCQEYPTVFAADLVQEANVAAAPNDAFLITLITNLKSKGIYIPITCSTFENDLTSPATAPWIYSMSQYFDFIDVHNYTYPITMQALDGLRTTFPDKDILLGEFGRAKNNAPDARVADLRQVMDLATSGDPRIRGGLIWAATDQDNVSSNQWGVYTSSFTVDNQDLMNLLRRPRYGGRSVQERNSRVW